MNAALNPRGTTPLLLTVIVLVLVGLQLGLSPRAFFAGDSGVKLIAAHNALRHPARPFDIDLPRLNGVAMPFVDPFFTIHGDHARAATSEVFPVVTAPLLELFGIRGVYILPAAGFLISIVTIACLGRALDVNRSPVMLLILSALATPLLFYGLEFWEHSLAVGLASTGTYCLALRPRPWAIASGSFLGIAILLRPEAALYSTAVIIASRKLPNPLTARQILIVLVAILAICVPLVTYLSIHSGRLFGEHISSNMALVGAGWWPERIAIVKSWTATDRPVWALAPLATLALAVLASRVKPEALIITATAIMTCGIAVAAAIGMFPDSSVWSAAPFVALALLGMRRRSSSRSFLTVTLGTYLALALLTAPNDGGAQWGPRYLLFALIPTVPLICDSFEVITPRRKGVRLAFFALIIGLALLVQRRAYRELQGSKRLYATIVESIRREAPPQGCVVTNLWWLDQVVAVLYPDIPVLYVGSAVEAKSLVSALRAAHVAKVAVVESRIDPIGFSVGDALTDTGWIHYATVDVAVRNLQIIQFKH